MNLKDCHNFSDFRILAKKKLPSPIFHYIDGAADDEITYNRNTSAFNDVDLVPNVLRGVENVDLSTTIFGKKIITEVKEIEKFYYAEDYHQDYEKKNPYSPYVQSVSIPRFNRFKQKASNYAKIKDIH